MRERDGKSNFYRKNLMPESATQTTWIDHIPALWIEPEAETAPRKLVIWIPYFSGCKEEMEPYLRELAAHGFYALSFDPWQHGERATETSQALQARVFAQFRRHMWPILAHSTLDAMRVMDWAVKRWNIQRGISIGGISMGGDVAVAAAGVDTRVTCAAAIVATPDWTRAGTDISPSESDTYSQFLFDLFNPLSHLDRYRHLPAIDFECGAEDPHVPPAGALQFRDALQETYRSHPDRLRVTLHPGTTHMATDLMWQNSREWICAH
jgi:dienelactone hydrolase